MPTTTAAWLAAAVWRKSSRSGDQGACVEVTVVPGATIVGPPAAVAVRDSKDPTGPMLYFPVTAWAAFAAAPPDATAR
jgi:hypothetical protein